MCLAVRLLTAGVSHSHHRRHLGSASVGMMLNRNASALDAALAGSFSMLLRRGRPSVTQALVGLTPGTGAWRAAQFARNPTSGALSATRVERREQSTFNVRIKMMHNGAGNSIIIKHRGGFPSD
jgi:hypothetical protein